MAAEIENHLISTFGGLFGYDEAGTEGTFTSGGAEANHTALLTAITAHFPDFPEHGVRSLPRQPVFYVSSQSHHSFLKAARFCGLGTGAVRHVEVDKQLRMSAGSLSDMIRRDTADGLEPFMVVASAGTTNAGVIDPLQQIADVARANGLWYHVDAAWGGAASFVSELKGYFAGMEQSDSITFDAHKWMSVPMGAGIYLTRHRGILNRTCAIETSYMPKDAAGLDIRDPYMHSMQWSRRSIGLKVFMSLAAAGKPGYESVIRHMTAMGDRLRSRLELAGFEICNETPLPVVCFRPTGVRDMQILQAIVRKIVNSGQAWISTTQLDGQGPVLRACITNFRTEAEHTDRLAELVKTYTAEVMGSEGQG
ncbi:MAG: aminotransferase class V-fold PLP-dependent enzyme [Balneolaceae bacterium]|nr:MAG: aminotransferase class V-fold PLP-dependent enzyme [Balneolaceae bacterium]